MIILLTPIAFSLDYVLKLLLERKLILVTLGRVKK